MKTYSILFALVVFCLSCKQNNMQADTSVSIISSQNSIAKTDTYSETLNAVFMAHGGIETWRAMQTLSFEISGNHGVETHTIDVITRAETITTDTYAMGYNGKEFWLQQDEEIYTRDNVKFYHNLMFYFYSMPFVLGDAGVAHTTVDDIEIDGQLYKGIKAYFKTGTGFSDKDNYIMYINKETNLLEWLAYTVTFGKDESSENYNFIKYTTWQTTNGLLTPKLLQWHTTEQGKPVKVRNELVFNNATFSKTKLDSTSFEAPKGAMVFKN